MKERDIIYYVLLVYVVLTTLVFVVILSSLDDRIIELEEKAKHFRCLEQRVSKYHQSYPRAGGGWFIAFDSITISKYDSIGGCSPIIK